MPTELKLNSIKKEEQECLRENGITSQIKIVITPLKIKEEVENDSLCPVLPVKVPQTGIPPLRKSGRSSNITPQQENLNENAYESIAKSGEGSSDITQENVIKYKSEIIVKSGKTSDIPEENKAGSVEAPKINNDKVKVVGEKVNPVEVKEIKIVELREMTSISVPSDGNCLLHSIAIAFLESTRDQEEFRRRFYDLFGTTFVEDSVLFYQQFLDYAINPNLYEHIGSNPKWATLINTFRHSLVRFMKSKSHDLSNSENAVYYMSKSSDFFYTESFDSYLDKILESGVWLGRLEILASSLMLKCCIVVQQYSNIIARFNQQSDIIINLDYINGNHYNFILKCASLPNQKRKLPIDELIINQNSANERFKRRKLDDYNIQYDSSNFNFLNGPMYQLKLLMLYLHRIQKLSDDFFLRNDFRSAERFDDVVLKYKMKGDILYKWRFLQAKYKPNPLKYKIRFNDLMSQKQHGFSLYIYFVSFYKIKTNKIFQDCELEDFCILTNTLFEECKTNYRHPTIAHVNKPWIELFSCRDLQNDPFLFFVGLDSLEVRFRQSNITDLGKLIKSSLALARSNENRMFHNIFGLLEMSKLIPDKIKQELTTLKIDITGTVLMKILLIEQKITKIGSILFKNEFFSLANDILKLKGSSKLQDIKQNLQRQKITKQSERKEFMKQLTDHLQETIKEMVHIEDYIQRHTLNSEDGTIKVNDLEAAFNNFDEYFMEFAQKFRFIINYPNLDELSSLLLFEIGVDEKLSSPDLFVHSFENIMTNWIRADNASFLSKEDREWIWKDIRDKIDTQQVIGLSKSYTEMLSSYGVTFKSCLSDIASFLQSAEVSILHLISTETQLTSIKLLDTLRRLATYKEFEWLNKDGSYIFIQFNSTKSLLSSLNRQNLYIIECSSNNNKSVGYAETFGKLGQNINEKIIIIGNENDRLVEEFKNQYDITRQQKCVDKTVFSDLSKPSQQNILSQKILLQGQVIQLSNIIDGSLANELIKEEFLINLIKKEPIIIGDVLTPHFSYHDQYYIPRKLLHQKLQHSILNSGLYLFVSNITEEQLVKFGVEKQNMCKYENYVSLKKIIFTESKTISEAQRYFEEVCRAAGQNFIQWIIFTSGYFEWMSSNGEVANVLKYVDEKSCSTPFQYSFEEDDNSGFTVSDEPLVIIADNPGIGKSTLLASVSLKIKECNPKWWVQVINLTDYSTEDHPYSLQNITFEVDSETASYVCSLVLPPKNGRPEINFIYELFKRCLLSTGDSPKNLNVVLLFDGFDEISMTYKIHTVKMLEFIRHTNVKQIWVATRLHAKDFLEAKLNIPALRLKHFTTYDKVTFLNKFLKWYLIRHKEDRARVLENLGNMIPNSYISENFELLTGFNNNKKYILKLLEVLKSNPSIEYVKYLFDNFDPKLHSFNLLLTWQSVAFLKKEIITANPRHLKMIAESAILGNYTFSGNFNILNLCEKIVSGTLKVFLEEKNNIRGNPTGKMIQLSLAMNYKKIFQELAVKDFLEPINITPLFFHLQNEIDNLNQFSYSSNVSKICVEEVLVQTGLVLVNRHMQLNFIDKSILPYFRFEWLVSQLQEGAINNMQAQEMLIKIILTEEDYSLTCEFLELFLSDENSKIGSFFSKRNIYFLLQYRSKIPLGNTILHLVTMRNHPKILNLLVGQLRKDLKYLTKILVATNRRKETSLRIAYTNKRVKCFRILLNETSLYCKESMYFDLQAIFQVCYMGLIDNTEDDSMIFKELLKFAKSTLPVESLRKLYLLPICPYYSKEYAWKGHCNILHVLVHLRRTSELKFLLIELQSYPIVFKLLLLDRNDKDLTPFSLALSKNDIKTVDLFITSLLTNTNLLRSMLLEWGSRGMTLQNIGMPDNPEVLIGLFETMTKHLGQNEYQEITRALVLSCNYQKDTIFLQLFNLKIDRNIIIQILDKLEFQTLCESVLLISIYGKSSSLQLKYNFLDWFQSCVAETKHNENSIVSDIIQITRRNIPAVMEETNSLIQNLKSSILIENISNIDAHDQKQMECEQFLAFKQDPFINILDFLSQNCELGILEVALDTLIKYPNILSTLILDTDCLGNTILHKLTTENKVEQINRILIKLSTIPDIINDLILMVNNNMETAAHLAVADTKLEIFKIMLTHVTDQDTFIDLILAINKYYKNILDTAIKEKYEDIVKIILSSLDRLNSDAIIDLVLPTYKPTEDVLFLCLKSSNWDICRLLFEYVLDRFGELKVKQLFFGLSHHPIMHKTTFENLVFGAAQQTKFFVMEILWKYSKIILDDPNEFWRYVLTTNTNNENFLHIACGQGFYKNIEYFLEELRGSSKLESLVSLLHDQSNDHKMTPLHYAVYANSLDSLEVLFAFCEKHLVGLFPNFLDKFLLATERHGFTPLSLAVKQNSEKCFSLVLSLANRLEKTQNGILKKLLLTTDLRERTVLHNIILQDNTYMLSELLEILELHPNIFDELALQVDRDGGTILHAPISGENVNNIKSIMTKSEHEKTFSQILVKENRIGLTPLHLAYWGCEPTNVLQDNYVQFLRTEMDNRNVNKETFLKLRKASQLAKKFENAIETRNHKKIRAIMVECQDFKKELFLMRTPTSLSFLRQAYESNDARIVESLFKNLKEDRKLFKYVFLTNELYYPAFSCDYEILSLILDYAKSIKDQEFYIHLLLDTGSLIQHIPNLALEKREMSCQLIKEEINNIAESILGTDRKFQIRHLGMAELLNLNLYVQSSEYTGPSQDIFINILKLEMYRRDTPNDDEFE